MHVLIAILYFMLALFGCDGWGAHTIATRAFDKGTQVLYSEASITPVLARFACVDSASGRCHYRLFSAACTPSAPTVSTTACVPGAVRDFVLGRGDSTQLVDAAERFEFCVSEHILPPGATCKPRFHAGSVAQSL